MSRETSAGRARVRQVCEAFGISRQAYYAARRAPEKRAKAVQPAKASTVGELEPRIRALAAGHRAWGVRKIWACLRREGLRVSHKRVWALMKAWGLVLSPAPVRERGELRGHVVVPGSNRRWASDLTTTWTRRDGVVAVVPVVDCGDRFGLEVEVTKSQESPAVLAPVKHSLEVEFGRPEQVPEGLELRSDHGSQYTGDDCAVLCRHWHLDHTFAPVGRPTGNAVAERLILTLKQELLWTQDWESIEELRVAVAGWLEEYNYRRPHQALGWKTPAEQREANLGRALAKAA